MKVFGFLSLLVLLVASLGVFGNSVLQFVNNPKRVHFLFEYTVNEDITRKSSGLLSELRSKLRSTEPNNKEERQQLQQQLFDQYLKKYLDVAEQAEKSPSPRQAADAFFNLVYNDKDYGLGAEDVLKQKVFYEDFYEPPRAAGHAADFFHAALHAAPRAAGHAADFFHAALHAAFNGLVAGLNGLNGLPRQAANFPRQAQAANFNKKDCGLFFNVNNKDYGLLPNKELP